MGRIVLAGVLAGLVVFLWGAVAHTVLPLGMVGMKVPSDAAQEAVLSSLRTQFDGEGIYMLPVPQRELWDNDAAMAKFNLDAAQRPFVFMAYQPQGRDMAQGFGGLLLRQAGANVLAGLLAAFIAAGIVGSRLRRVLSVAALGLFAWLVMAVPYWNWYRFPADFTAAALAEQAVGWLFGGLVIAFVLRPRPA